MIFDKQTEEEILNELTMLRNNLNVFRESEVKVRLTIIMELVEKYYNGVGGKIEEGL